MTTSSYLLTALAVVCLAAALVYVRSARLRYRVVRLIDADVNRDVEAHSLTNRGRDADAHGQRAMAPA